MTHPNLEMIDKFFEAYGKRDMEILHRVMDDQIRWTVPGQNPYSGAWEGIDKVLTFFDTMGAAMGNSNVKVEKLIMSANDNYVIECQHVWTNRADGFNLDHLVCVLWRFKNGKIIEGHHFFSDPQATDIFFNHMFSVGGL